MSFQQIKATGKLVSLHTAKAKGGDWVSGANLFHLDPGDPQLRMYGISTAINVKEYVRLHRLAIASVELPEVTTMLYQIYGFDKIIRQDELTNGGVVASRFFRPSITEEEAVLNHACESGFRQEQENGLSTVD